MIQYLRTEKDKDRARALAKSVLFHLRRAIVECERLQKLYDRVHDFGTANTIAFHVDNLRDDLSSEDGECGLEPFLHKLIKEQPAKP